MRPNCSQKCMGLFHWNLTKENLLFVGSDNSCTNRIGKKYLIELHNGKCQICGLSKWNAMPLVIDYISYGVPEGLSNLGSKKLTEEIA